MENPIITFASPTIIVGDKSMTDVAIHGIFSINLYFFIFC